MTVERKTLTKHILEFKRKILLKIHPTKTKQGNQPYLHFSRVILNLRSLLNLRNGESGGLYKAWWLIAIREFRHSFNVLPVNKMSSTLRTFCIINTVGALYFYRT